MSTPFFCFSNHHKIHNEHSVNLKLSNATTTSFSIQYYKYSIHWECCSVCHTTLTPFIFIRFQMLTNCKYTNGFWTNGLGGGPSIHKFYYRINVYKIQSFSRSVTNYYIYDEQISSQFKLHNFMSKLMHILQVFLFEWKEREEFHFPLQLNFMHWKYM